MKSPEAFLRLVPVRHDVGKTRGCAIRIPTEITDGLNLRDTDFILFRWDGKSFQGTPIKNEVLASLLNVGVEKP